VLPSRAKVYGTRNSLQSCQRATAKVDAFAPSLLDSPVSGIVVCDYVEMGNLSTNPQTAFKEQRTATRYSLIAVIELTDPLSDVRLTGRISEVSSKGCFVDILNTLPVGTLVQVRIIRDQGTFCCSGKIVYAQEPMGMGIVFVEIAAVQQSTLDNWLTELSAI
jgi:hypothetical protein